MGFTAPRTVYRLKFEDPAYDGLEVRVASVPIGKLLALADQADKLKGGTGDGAVDLHEVRELFTLFVSSLRSWNLEDEAGVPVPTTLDGLLGQEYGFAIELVMVWMDAVSGVPAPLARRSTNGSRSEELSLPMETLSESPIS